MKKPYIPPTLTVVKFHVESGFAGTSESEAFNMSFLNNNNDYAVRGNEASSYQNEHWQW